MHTFPIVLCEVESKVPNLWTLLEFRSQVIKPEVESKDKLYFGSRFIVSLRPNCMHVLVVSTNTRINLEGLGGREWRIY